MHFLLAAILFVLVYALLWRPWYTQWRLNREIRRHLPPPGGWPAMRQPAPPAAPQHNVGWGLALYICFGIGLMLVAAAMR